MRGENEAALVRGAIAGDVRAFDQLVRFYRKALRFEAVRILGESQADDAVQDGLLIAFKALPRLREPDRFSVWIRTVVRNRAIRISQGEVRQRTALDELLLRHSPELVTPIEDCLSVRNELDGLADEDRLIVSLHYYEEWSLAQIAAYLGKPESTVKWRMHQSRKRLRARLAPEGNYGK